MCAVLWLFACCLPQNASKDEYVDMCRVAAANTWPAIPRIRAHCLIEMTLDRCVQRLRKRILDQDLVCDSDSGGEQQAQGQRERQLVQGVTAKDDEAFNKARRERGDTSASIGGGGGGGRGLGGRTGKGKMDRTPSFYTSKSIINLSGLSVSDPAPAELHQYHGSHGTHGMHAPASSSSQHSPEGMVGMSINSGSFDNVLGGGGDGGHSGSSGGNGGDVDMLMVSVPSSSVPLSTLNRTSSRDYVSTAAAAASSSSSMQQQHQHQQTGDAAAAAAAPAAPRTGGILRRSSREGASMQGVRRNSNSSLFGADIPEVGEECEENEDAAGLTPSSPARGNQRRSSGTRLKEENIIHKYVLF
jgi:hypothetical protein